MRKLREIGRKIKRKRIGNKGFSLTELLVAMLIMLLATGALVGTIGLAVKHFFKSAQESEAQLLCATLSEFVEDELTYSKSVASGDGGVVTWSKGTHGLGSNIYFEISTDAGNFKGDESTSATYGQIVITSKSYQKEYGDDKVFNLASPGVYEVGKSRNYDLQAAMSLSWDDGKYEVEIIVADKSKEALASSSFTVKPVLVSASKL